MCTNCHAERGNARHGNFVGGLPNTVPHAAAVIGGVGAVGYLSPPSPEAIHKQAESRHKAACSDLNRASLLLNQRERALALAVKSGSGDSLDLDTIRLLSREVDAAEATLTAMKSVVDAARAAIPQEAK